MDIQKNEHQKKFVEIIITGISLILIFLVSFIYFNYLSPKKIEKTAINNLNIQKEKPNETAQVSMPKTIYNLTGRIENLEANAIVFEANIPTINNNGEAVSKVETRKVIISPDTKFTALKFVDQEGGKKTPLETTITLKDFKAGDLIEVISNEDISKKEDFLATQVRILPQ